MILALPFTRLFQHARRIVQLHRSDFSEGPVIALSVRGIRGAPVRHDQRGATAIEYALIAGLIGLGIIGSLVTTKTSLNGIFGSLSGQMASASPQPGGSQPSAGSTAPATPAAPTLNFNVSNSRSSYWAQKTVASGPTLTQRTSGDFWTTIFTDGSKVVYYKENTGNQTIQYDDVPNLISTYLVLDSSGKSNNGSVYSYNASTFSAQTQKSYMYSDSFSGLNPISMYAGACTPSACTGPNGPASQQFVTAMNNAYYDIGFWSANAPYP